MEFSNHYFNFFELNGKLTDDLIKKLKEILINHMNQNLKDEEEVNSDLVLLFNLEDNDSNLAYEEIIHLCNLIKACDDTIYGIITGKCKGIATLLFLSICSKNRYAFNNTAFILDKPKEFNESVSFYENPYKNIYHKFLNDTIKGTKIKKNITSTETLILSDNDMLNYNIIRATLDSFSDLETIEDDEDEDEEIDCSLEDEY